MASGRPELAIKAFCPHVVEGAPVQWEQEDFGGQSWPLKPGDSGPRMQGFGKCENGARFAPDVQGRSEFWKARHGSGAGAGGRGSSGGHELSRQGLPSLSLQPVGKRGLARVLTT